MTDRVVAPAKLTVTLHVVGVRPDGYHELEAEMVSLSLHDVLEFERGDGLEIVLGRDVEAGLSAGEDNLVHRALRVVERRASVRLHKRIPVQGGLGGGSSDAAAVLRWAGCGDLTVGAALGADVPFCMVGGRARVEGIGEVVTPLPATPQSYVLLLPPFGVSTAAVFAAFDQGAPEPARPFWAPGRNDLTAAALGVRPELEAWGRRLAELSGARPVLAGSGSTWFVEGRLADFDLDPGRPVGVEDQQGRLLEVHTVAAPGP